MKNFSSLPRIFSFLIFGIILLIPLFSHSRTFYVSISGDDGNIGSIDKPWFSLGRSVRRLKGGDSLFVRGGLYREFGISVSINASSSSKVLIKNFNNEIPIIQGSQSLDNENDWVNNSGNIWSISISSYDIGNIWHDEKASQKKYAFEDLHKQWDFYFDHEKKLLYLYSIKKPTLFSKNLEACISKVRGQHGCIIQNSSYVTIEGIVFKYVNSHGIQITNSDNITIKNVVLKYGGGSTLDFFNKVRYGNGIEIWNSASNILVEGCKIFSFYDSGLTNQGKNGLQDSIVFNNNTIVNTKCGIEHWGDSLITIRNIYWTNNLIKDSGDNWAMNEQNVWGGICLSRTPHTTANFVISKNRLVNCGSEYSIIVRNSKYNKVSNENVAFRIKQGGNYVIVGNIICSGPSHGIYISGDFTGIVYNNLVFDQKGSGIIIDSHLNKSLISNNTIANNGNQDRPNVVANGINDVWEYNIFYSRLSKPIYYSGGVYNVNCSYPYSALSGSSINANPLFVNIRKNNYDLKQDSPCLIIPTYKQNALLKKKFNFKATNRIGYKKDF